MGKKSTGSKSKGALGKAGLPLAQGYVRPRSRATLFVAGSIAAAVLLAYALLDQELFGGRFLSSGPLSSHHSSFESSCDTCHSPFRDIAETKCTSCHIKPVEQKDKYTFAAHYVNPPVPERLHTIADFEQSCAVCHLEHQGREKSITSVPDSDCTGCHRFDSFNTDHPEFEFIRESKIDDSALQFTHILHVDVIRSESDSDSSAVEDACLACHVPIEDGRRFAELNYEKHCSRCHLPAAQGRKNELGESKLVHRDPRVLSRLERIQGRLQALSAEKAKRPAQVRADAMKLLREVRTLTSECKACHTIPEAAILPVQRDQRELVRARFNHQPHVLIQSCLDCHTRIPLTPAMLAGAAAEAANDMSRTLNLPAIDNCRQCHAPAEASNDCIVCHAFHPGS